VEDAARVTFLVVLLCFICTESELEIHLTSFSTPYPYPFLLCAMSRTARGGSRGGFGGRPSFGSNNPPPMGLTFADIQAMSREQSALYPVCPRSPLYTFILTALRMCFVAPRAPPCTDRIFRGGEAYMRATMRLCSSTAQVCLSRDGSNQVE
jgi:hypothetical protein